MNHNGWELTPKQLETAGRKLAIMRGQDPDRRVHIPPPPNVRVTTSLPHTTPYWQLCSYEIMNIFMITVALEETIMEEKNDAST